MRLLDEFRVWRARRRHLKHRARLRKMGVVLHRRIEPSCIVRPLREPNRWR